MRDMIILAGGLGTRLRSVVADRPKVLAPVAGRPFVAWLLDAAVRGGATRILMSVGYMADAVSEAVGSDWGGIPVDYVREEDPLGTGGAIAAACAHSADPAPFVMNGDSFSEVDFDAMAAAHEAADAAVTIAAVSIPDVGRYGALDIQGGRIVSFLEKGGTGPGLINGGIYRIRTAAMAGLPERFSLEADWLAPRIAELRPLAFRVGGRFIDIGVPDDYARAQQMFGDSAR
jgi:D-glycero-alpha-D-manno-heptose 1-phosphate guanylyltransferase